MRPASLGRLKVSWQTIVGIAVGSLLATLSFSHIAASAGIPMEPFRPLGGSFFAWKASQARLIAGLDPTGKGTRNLPLKSFGRAVLRHAPLSARPTWLVGLGYEVENDRSGTRRAMLTAERISRREAGPQLWLAQDAARRDDAESAMAHFDILLRTNGEIVTRLAPAMASMLTLPEGRNALRRYVNEDTPWLPAVILAAAQTLPSARPLAEFLLDVGKKAPNGDTEREAYRTMLRRLADEHAYSLMARVYPLLPGADASRLRTLTTTEASDSSEYPPFDWQFSDSEARGATPLLLQEGRQGIEFFAAAGTIGVAGTKLLLPTDARRVQFRIAERTVNSGSSAHWIATCVTDRGDGATTRSADLSSARENTPIQFDLPATCPIVRLDLRIAGGLGRESSQLLIESLALIPRR